MHDCLILLCCSCSLQMSTGSLMFSLLQLHTCKIHSLASCCGGAVHSVCKTYANNSSVRLLGSRIYGLEGGLNKDWNQRVLTTKAKGIKQATVNTKLKSTNHEISRGKILTSDTVNVDKTQLGQYQKIQYPGMKQEIAPSKDLSDLVTVIVFDLETTGYSRVHDRIVEIALRDLQGGENSTFQALVNPQRHVPNSHIHGIVTQMVNRPDVPRMEDLIPILLQYVRSRQKPGGDVLWVAHNARGFDAPFLTHEFSRCSAEVPDDWRFLDSRPLAHDRMKIVGTNLSTSLAALSEFYGIKVDGSAHRAMVDVNTLSEILPLLTCDLKLTLPCLIKKSFGKSDLMKVKKN